MKRKMIATITVSALFITLISGIAFAQKGSGFRVCIHPKVMKELNLTDEQETAIRGKEAELKKKMIQLKADMAMVKIDQKQIMRERNFNLEDARSNTGKIADLKSRMDTLKLDAAVALRDVLTDDQWKKMVELKETMKPGKGKRGGRGHGESGHHRDRFQAALQDDRAAN